MFTKFNNFCIQSKIKINALPPSGPAIIIQRRNLLLTALVLDSYIPPVISQEHKTY